MNTSKDRSCKEASSFFATARGFQGPHAQVPLVVMLSTCLASSIACEASVSVAGPAAVVLARRGSLPLDLRRTAQSEAPIASAPVPGALHIDYHINLYTTFLISARCAEMALAPLFPVREFVWIVDCTGNTRGHKKHDLNLKWNVHSSSRPRGAGRPPQSRLRILIYMDIQRILQHEKATSFGWISPAQQEPPGYRETRVQLHVRIINRHEAIF